MKPILTALLWQLAALLTSALAAGTACADEIRVAVAANFSTPIKQLVSQFSAQTGHTVLVSTGASGKFYSQIKQGAPFDLFLSADSSTPEKLEQEGLTVPQTRVTYAIGQLVLYSANKDLVDAKGTVLALGHFQHLALAQPKLAPYGMAGQQVLEKLKLWDSLQARLVFGENVAQTQQFIDSGNAELGFVALSQVLNPASGTGPGGASSVKGSIWRVPQNLYQPILQQMVMLSSVKSERATRQFWQFLQNDAAHSVIRQAGYTLPAP